MSFKSDLEDDLETVFFDPNVFGIEFDYTPEGGSTKTLNGLFDADKTLSEGDYMRVHNDVIQLYCRTIDIWPDFGGLDWGAFWWSGDAARVIDDEITIEETTYLVKNFAPGPEGMVILDLVQK